MIQISYVSTAIQPLSPAELLALLEECVKNNNSRGLTGMLLYANGTFLQVLEGEEPVIDAVLEKIRKDPRHARLQLLRRSVVASRQYSDWSMGFQRITDQELQRIEGLKDFGTRDFTFEQLSTNEAAVDALMEHYRAPHWDPLVREIDAKDKVIDHLKTVISNARSHVAFATLMIESAVDATRAGGLNDDHLRLFEAAVETLRGI